jgi:phosphoserine aminotransferase
MFEELNIPAELLPEDGRFGSGPAKVPLHFLEKLKETGTKYLGNSHRNPVILDLVSRCQEKLKKYFSLPADYEILLGNGGASQIWEMLSFSVIREKSAHFACGEFSAKWHSLTSAAPWLQAEKFESGYGTLPELAYDGDADLIAITQNETSTGVMIPGCPDFGNKEALLAVDATSIAGVTPWDWDKTDIYYFSLQKAFGSEGGLHFSIASPRFAERVEQIGKTGRYIPSMLSFQEVISNSRKNQTLNTPSISTLFFLECALDEFISRGGIKAVRESSQAKAELVYSYAEGSKYLSPYVKKRQLRSLSVATIDVSDEIPADDLVKSLRRNGILDINSYRKLGRNQIRIGIFPLVAKADLEKLIASIDYALQSVSNS